jgi:hypothetical protein
MTLLTQADYARRRGCSDAAVNEARKQRIKAAEVIRDGQVFIDAEKADELWAKNSRRRRQLTAPSEHPTRRAVTAKAKPIAKVPDREDLKAFIMGLPEDQIPDDVNEIIRRKEHYNAECQRLKALKERGEVVPAAEVKNEAFARARAVRDALLGLADRLAPILAATTDARECHRLITEEHRIALRGLANG